MREGLLSEFITLKRGYDLPHRDRKDGEVPIISSSGPTGTHNVAKKAGPGVVTGRYGTLGEVFYTEQDYWPLNTALYVMDFKGNYPRFIYYFMHTLGLGQRNAAGAVPGVNRNVLHKMPVRVPALPVQRRTADILSAYDDLIENNNRRMALLEESIHLLYREWFVYLRFPGHERVEVVNGVPKGWEPAAVGDLIDAGTVDLQTGPFGTQLRASDYTETGTPVINVRNIGYGRIRPDKLEHVPPAMLDKLPNHLLAPGDIVFGRKGAVDRHVLVGRAEAGWMQGSDCIRLRLLSGPISPTYLSTALLMPEHKEWILSQSSNKTTMASLNQKIIRRIPVWRPSVPVLEEFSRVAAPVQAQVRALSDANERLREARDLLLPRLMDGRIPV